MAYLVMAYIVMAYKVMVDSSPFRVGLAGVLPSPASAPARVRLVCVLVVVE